MKTTLAKMTGLALLAASFAFCGPLAYADAEETAAIQVLTVDAVGNPGEVFAVFDCDTEDGMGGCPVDIAIAEAPAETTVADASDSAVLEAAAAPAAETDEAAIRSVDAIIAEVDQTTVIVVPGNAETVIEEPAQTATVAASAAEPTAEDKTASDAIASQPNEEKAGEASAAILVEVTQSATVAAPGQPVDEEPVVTGSVTESSAVTPVSMLDGKNCDEDF
jgi:hypothetical protein